MDANIHKSVGAILGSADYWELLKTVLCNPPLGCGIPWHLTKCLCCPRPHHVRPVIYLTWIVLRQELCWFMWPTVGGEEGKKSQLCSGGKKKKHCLESVLLLLKLEMVARWRNRGSRLQLLISCPLLLLLCCRLSLSVLPQLLRSPLPCAPAAVCFERAICSSSQPSDREGNEQCDGRRQPLVERGHRLDSYPLTA